MELGSNDFDSKREKEDKHPSPITGFKREHDSVDDFEHLDHEISPLKDLPSVDFPQSQVDNLIDHKDFVLDSFSKTLEPSKQLFSETVHSADNLLSDFSTRSKPKDETLVFGSEDPSFFGDLKKDVTDIGKHDVMKFLEAETSYNDKTDKESDLTRDALDSKNILSETPKPLSFVEGTTGKLIDNIEDRYDTLIENIHDSFPAELNKEFGSSIKSTKLEPKVVSNPLDLKSDFDTEEIDSTFEPASTIGEIENITHNQSKEGSPFDNIVGSQLTNDPVERFDSTKPLTPVVETKPTVEPLKQPEIVNPTELDEFLDTEPVTNEPEHKIEPIPEPKPVPVVVPVKPVDRDVKQKDKTPVKVKTESLDDIIGPEDVFKKIGLDAWFNPDRLHPKVEALVYWRDPKKSGVVFGGVLAILLSLAYLSLISVVAYVSLFTLFGTIVFRVYKSILQAVQKTSDGHPFKEFLEIELSLPQDKVQELTETAVTHINAALVELRRLFLVEDLVDSIKFAVLLWCLTYIGALFNGLTLVILGFVGLFTIPKVYENNKTSIDAYLDIGRSKIAEITSKVKAAVPIGKKEAEKEKDQ